MGSSGTERNNRTGIFKMILEVWEGETWLGGETRSSAYGTQEKEQIIAYCDRKLVCSCVSPADMASRQLSV